MGPWGRHGRSDSGGSTPDQLRPAHPLQVLERQALDINREAEVLLSAQQWLRQREDNLMQLLIQVSGQHFTNLVHVTSGEDVAARDALSPATEAPAHAELARHQSLDGFAFPKRAPSPHAHRRRHSSPFSGNDKRRRSGGDRSAARSRPRSGDASHAPPRDDRSKVTPSHVGASPTMAWDDVHGGLPCPAPERAFGGRASPWQVVRETYLSSARDGAGRGPSPRSGRSQSRERPACSPSPCCGYESSPDPGPGSELYEKWHKVLQGPADGAGGSGRGGRRRSGSGSRSSSRNGGKATGAEARQTLTAHLKWLHDMNDRIGSAIV